MPLRVIEDSDESVVAHLAEGTAYAASVLIDGRGLREVPLEERWAHPRRRVVRTWLQTDVVMIVPREPRLHSLWAFREDGKLTGWYVNLEATHIFGERTISTVDGVLDVWVPSDTRTPAWKDEDELAMAVQVGRLTEAEAAAFRSEGERVLRERPWPTRWDDWVAPPEWEPAVLPPDWDSRP